MEAKPWERRIKEYAKCPFLTHHPLGGEPICEIRHIEYPMMEYNPSHPKCNSYGFIQTDRCDNYKDCEHCQSLKGKLNSEGEGMKCCWCDYETDIETDAHLHLVYFHEEEWGHLAGEYKKGTALDIMKRLNQPRDRKGRLKRLNSEGRGTQ